MSKRIALDIDDVLAGFVIGLHEAFGKELFPHNQWCPNESSGQLILRKDELGNIIGMTEEYLDKCEHNKDFWYSLEPITLPADIPLETVCYITASPKNMVDVRMEWLKKHGFPTLPVIHSKDKYMTMKRLRIDLLVDDKLLTVENVRERGTEDDERGIVGPPVKAIHFKPWYSTLKESKSINSLLSIILS